MIGQGMMALQAGDIAKADASFENAAKTSKNKDPKVFIAISQAIANSNIDKKDKAIEWAKKAVDMNPRNFDFRIAYGDAFLSTQDGGQAITQYEYAAEIDKTSALPNAKIGRVYYNSRTYDLSKEYLEKALVTDPNNLFALNYMAQLLYKYKKYDEAKAMQQKILDLGDKNPDDMAMMANILFLGKDYKGAIDIINQIIQSNNKYNYLNRLIGYSYFEEGQASQALDFMEKFIASQPKDKIINSDYEYLGKSYLGIGDTVKAVESFKHSVDLFPEDKDAMRSVADLFKKIKRNQDALELYKKLTAMPDATVADHLKLANIYFYQFRDFDNADVVYSKVIELSPNQVDVYFNKAKIKLFKEPNQETSSAKEDFARYIEMTKGKEEKYKKNVIEANIYMAKDAIKNMNDKALAKTYLDGVLQLDPTHVEATDLMKFTN
jgi:tetratricopeptide (TPR) repeat protein